jgi:dCMP deaminase
MPKTDINEIYMNIAAEIGKLSYAERKQVGAILVKDGSIISTGYNGTPHGFDNNCEETMIKYYDNPDIAEILQDQGWHLSTEAPFDARKQVTKREVLHAESNAISKVAKSTHSSEGSVLYVTLSPCYECAKLIIQSGIKRVVYKEQYRMVDGIQLLQKAGIPCVQC